MNSQISLLKTTSVNFFLFQYEFGIITSMCYFTFWNMDIQLMKSIGHAYTLHSQVMNNILFTFSMKYLISKAEFKK